MNGSIPPLPNTPSWRGAQLKNTGTILPSPLYLTLPFLYSGLLDMGHY